MVKQKDYFTPIVMGTIWGIFCLALSVGIWWIVKLATDNNILIAYIFSILSFCFGIYKGKEFYKIEMKTVKKNDPQTNLLGVLGDVQILLLAVIFVNTINIFNDGFTWAGLGAFICGLLFVWILLYAKNTRFSK